MSEDTEMYSVVDRDSGTIYSFNAADRKKLEGFIQEISNSMLRMDAERELIKDICNRAKAELELKPKIVRNLGRIYHKQSLIEEKSEADSIFDLYETLFG